jgi:hypothetical protein
MLFRALITRMCRCTSRPALDFGGTSGFDPGLRISFQRYPGLVELLSKLLDSPGYNKEPREEISSVPEQIFPALELIGERIPSVSNDADSMLRGLTLQQAGNRVWAVREQAARVYVSLLNLSSITKDISSLLAMDGSILNQNSLHGRVLCIRYALLRLWLSPYGEWCGMSQFAF